MWWGYLRFSFVLLILFPLFPALGQARSFDKLPASRVEEGHFTAEDGATMRFIHLKSPEFAQGTQPILVATPGLGAKDLSLELPATAAAIKGHAEVYIGNWRGSAMVKGQEPFGPSNGLFEVVRKDYPAFLREVLRRATPQQKAQGLILLGHSMGGMMIMGMLSDPKLHAEFAPYIRGIVLFQSPHHVGYLRPLMRAAAYAGIPALKALKALGVTAIDIHSRLLYRSKTAKLDGGIAGKLITPAIENLAIALTRAVLNPAYTGREHWRRAVFKMSADAIPVDLLMSFAQAVVNGGEFRGPDGLPLILPQATQGIPVQVIRTRLDTLAPWKEQAEYFHEIGSQDKQLVDVYDMNHIDSVLITRADADFFHHVLAFIADPARAVRTQRFIEFRPGKDAAQARAVECEALLAGSKRRS